MNPKFNREKTIIKLRKYLKDNGYNSDSIIRLTHLQKILKQLKLCTDTTIRKKLGSIQNLAKEVGFIYLGNQPRSTKEKTIINIKKFFNKHNNKVSKTFLYNNLKNIDSWKHKAIAEKIGSFDNLAKEAGVKFIYIGGGIGKNEKLILDDIEKKRKIKIERQYQVGKFKLDGYYIEGNEAFEIDGICHNEKKVKALDLIREEIIKEIISCSFTRIDEKEYLRNMIKNETNKII